MPQLQLIMPKREMSEYLFYLCSDANHNLKNEIYTKQLLSLIQMKPKGLVEINIFFKALFEENER